MLSRMLERARLVNNPVYPTYLKCSSVNSHKTHDGPGNTNVLVPPRPGPNDPMSECEGEDPRLCASLDPMTSSEVVA